MRWRRCASAFLRAVRIWERATSGGRPLERDHVAFAGSLLQKPSTHANPGTVATQVRVDVVHAVPVPTRVARGEDRSIGQSLLLVLRRRELRDRECRHAAPVDRVDVLRESNRMSVGYDDSPCRTRQMLIVAQRARRMFAPRTEQLVREVQAQLRARPVGPRVREEPPFPVVIENGGVGVAPALQQISDPFPAERELASAIQPYGLCSPALGNHVVRTLPLEGRRVQTGGTVPRARCARTPTPPRRS